MTLIVGVRTQQRLQILSDTRISHPDITQVEELPGRLKLVLIRPDTCVAFAGRADHATDIIRSIRRHDGNDVLNDKLFHEHVASDKSIDFIVATTRSHQLTRIADGRIENATQETWIGDADGELAYQHQKLYVTEAVGTDPELAPLATAVQAFDRLLRLRLVPSVAGLQVRVGSSPEGFIYLDQAGTYYPQQSIPTGIATSLMFGGPAQGGFAYTLLVPRAPGISVVAVYFLQGSLGFIYAPLTHDRPVQVSNVTHDDLRQYVGERYGVEVDGLKFG